MRIRIAVTAAAVALVAAGCGESCPTESPQVSALAAGCTQVAGQPVDYPVRLCPTCNQTAASCDVDLSQVGSGTIFLDPKVEACTGSSGCPPACSLNTLTCTFVAPATPGSYSVLAYDPGSNTTRQSTLLVIASGAESCSLTL